MVQSENNKKKCVIYIHAYGHPDPKRGDGAGQGYLDYLEEVKAYCNGLKKSYNIDCIVLCGGLEDETGTSEAADLYNRWANWLKNIRCLLMEQKSTVSIVEYSFQNGTRYSDDDLIFIVDNARKLKTKYLAWHFSKKMKSRPHYEIVGFERVDTNPRSLPIFQFLQLVIMMIVGVERMRKKIESTRS